ncbi:MAG: Fur family transcriptional regulator [Myxococcota bacterium]|jgi:Fur family ferric uptake transcriptional regulator|nr:Fur family transcriptional regulator [Myxococcota bacterium]
MAETGHTNWPDSLERALRERGLRLTTQRRAIAEIFFGVDGHPNADELFATVRATHPAIGQATIYRTLRLFEEVGLASSSNFGSTSARFEANDGHHHDHLVCTECDDIIEFVNETIERLQDEVAEAHGFELTSHRMELYGLCSNCRSD